MKTTTRKSKPVNKRSAGTASCKSSIKTATERKKSGSRSGKWPQTGLLDDWKFFSGGSALISGDMHWWPAYENDYERVAVHQIFWRIKNDVEELFNRARIQEAVDADEAVAALASAGTTTAQYLENLFVKRRERITKVAARSAVWPVNLSLRKRWVETKTEVSLDRKTFALEYLTGIRLGESCKYPTRHDSGAERISPLRLAAEDLYRQMMIIKELGTPAFEELTPWYKAIMELPIPMATSNAHNWWKVAKVFLDERWRKAPHEFDVIVDYLRLRLSSKCRYKSASRIKSRVIDNDLKKAFRALARPEL